MSETQGTGTDRSESIEDSLMEAVERRTEPDPDGHQDVHGGIWTGLSRLKQEASKGNVPCDRDEIPRAVNRLAEDGRLISWHGLLAPATEDHLQAIIENERLADVSRSALVGKCNRLLQRGDGA